MIHVEVKGKMTGLTDSRIVYRVSRTLSIAIFICGIAVFFFTSYTGFYTWKTGLHDHGWGVEAVLAIIELMIFFPGLSPMLVAYYFFIHHKFPIYNLIGLIAMLPAIFIHFLSSVPAAHSSVFGAIGFSIAELILVLVLLWLFDRFVVRCRDEEDETTS